MKCQLLSQIFRNESFDSVHKAVRMFLFWTELIWLSSKLQRNFCALQGYAWGHPCFIMWHCFPSQTLSLALQGCYVRLLFSISHALLWFPGCFQTGTKCLLRNCNECIILKHAKLSAAVKLAVLHFHLVLYLFFYFFEQHT